MMLSLLPNLIKVYTWPYFPPAWQSRMTEKRVIKTVRDAYFNVPFYRRKYDSAGIDITRIRRLEDMKRLPVLTKEEIRRNFPGSMVRRGTNLKKCFHSSTSGSSGQPLSFVISPSGYAYYLAESARIYSMIGYRPWHRSCYIRLVSMHLPAASLIRQTHISSGQPVADQIEQLKKARPDLIDTGVVRLLNIAMHLGEDDLKYIKPRFITINSEMSTEKERAYLSRVFKCPVYDEYGTEETWSIATQCRRHRYHISSDSVWLEFLDGHGRDVDAGEVGDIFITTTRSEAMPFIRYNIGDRGRPEGGICGCGYKSPLMKSIEGRANDWLVLPSGKLFAPSQILSTYGQAVWQNPGLFAQFRIVQKAPDVLALQYVKGPRFAVNELEKLVEKLKELFDEPIDVSSEEVSQLGEKRQVVQSLVPRRIDSAV
jgi:phenylacetate-CoA ligase